MTAEIAVVGAQRPEVQAALEAEFTVHNVYQEPDRAAALEPIAERIRGVVTNAMAGVPTEVIDALPKLEIAAIMGVGLEKTDVSRAKERGITVTDNGKRVASHLLLSSRANAPAFWAMAGSA